MNLRIGMGYDVHKLVTGRKLILAGIAIPYEYGLLGHSDADVITHAIMDAILGAMAKGDIGRHFPDTNEKYKGISSITLLEYVKQMMDDEGYEIVNIDSVIVAQKPRLAPYIDEMVKSLVSTLHVSTTQLNIKATTEEGLGFTGEGLGISAKAVVMLSKGTINLS